MKLNEKGYTLSIVIILLAALALRLYRLGVPSLFVDEAFALSLSQHSIEEICATIIARDQHPPLYFIFLHYWRHLGSSELMLRLPSAVLSTIVVYLTFLLGSALVSRSAGLVAALFCAFSPGMLFIMNEAKTHAPGLPLILLALYIFILAARGEGRGKRLWIVHTVVLILAFLTHYLTLFLVLVEAIFCLVYKDNRRLWKQWLISIGAFVIVTLPWSIHMLQQAQNRISQPSVYTSGLLTFLDLFTVLISGFSFYLDHPLSLTVSLPFLAVAVYGLAVQREHRFEASLLFVWVIALPAALSLSSFLPVKLFTPKYLFIVTASGYYILLASGILAMLKRYKITAAALIIALAALYAVSLYNWLYVPYYGKHNWKGALSYVSAGISPDDLVIVQNDYQKYSFLYYYRGTAPVEGCDTLDDVRNAVARHHFRRLYFVEASARAGDPSRSAEKWLQENYPAIEACGFPNMDKDFIITVIVFSRK
ncbi:MAG: glycosyltransferase family 39 protein [Candidatus Xenobiia bacterium LiM19]